MAKSTRKPGSGRKPKNQPLSCKSPVLALIAKNKLIHKTCEHSCTGPHAAKLRELVNEEVLSCSICLELLLSPVLAQCGHAFCLHCAEDLASHGFACGICHSHHPALDLPSSPVIETLLEDYLLRS